MTDFLTSYLLTVAITCGAGALLWAGESLFPGRIPAGLRKVLWFLLLARLALPLGLRDPAELLQNQRPALPAASSAVSPVPLPVTLPPAEEGVEALKPLEDRVAGELIASSPTEPLSAFPWAAVVLGILYFAGFGSLLTRRIHSSLKLNHLLMEAKANTGNGSALLDGVKHRWNLAGPLALQLVPGISSPALVGLIKPRILLPAGLEETFSPQEREIMLDHEAAHLRAGDPWWILAADLITLALWFLPQVWIFRGRLVAALEEACDRRVLERRREITPRDYGLTLLKVLSTPAPFGAPLPAMASPRRLVKARIRLIAQPKQASLLLTALALAALLGACSLGVRVMEKQPAPEKNLAEPASTSPETEVSIPVIPLDGKKTESPDPSASAAAEPEAETWTWPLKGVRGTVTSYHGIAQHPFTGMWYFHKGIDIASPVGTPLVAPLDGQISGMGWDVNGYGLYLEMDHPGEYSTRIAHLSKIFPNAVGTPITRGQTVALVGSTGYSTGPHVHFEVQKPWEFVGELLGGKTLLDPAPFLGIESRKNPTIQDDEPAEDISPAVIADEEVVPPPRGLTLPAIPSQPVEPGTQEITFPADSTLVLPAEVTLTRIHRRSPTSLWILEFISDEPEASGVIQYSGFQTIPWILPGTKFQRGEALPSGMNPTSKGIQFRIRLGSGKTVGEFVYADLSQAFD